MPPELDDWRLVTMTGWTLPQCDSAPAVRSDWLIKIDDAMHAQPEYTDGEE